MINWMDGLIDRITMYRLIVYYLVALLGAAFVLGLFGLAPVEPAALALSTGLVLSSGYLANTIFARVFGAVPNIESVYITGLIVVLIMPAAPVTDLAAVGAVVAATVWAMASKFLLSARRRHIFNPAALGVALPALLLDQPATWWVATSVWLLPIVIVGGLMIVRKLRRFDMVLAFGAACLAATVLTGDVTQAWTSISVTLLETPFFFFAFVMLTEPLTAPQAPAWRVVYGALIGVLSSPNMHLGGYYFTPEVALLVGNLLTLAVSPQGRVVLTLRRIEKAAAGAYDFVFRPDHRLAFSAGQYLEWTLPTEAADSRGNRRYFTLASAPNDDEIRLGVKFSPQGSAFKRGLAQMRPGDQMVASQLAGSFVLPRNSDTKLAFIAGGIGITPFRSMLADLLARGEKRDIVVLYGAAKLDEVAYPGVLDAASEQLGIPTYLVLADASEALPGEDTGFIDAAMIRRRVPDFAERTFYVSGPNGMVRAVRKALRSLSVPFWRIKADFFPGLA